MKKINLLLLVFLYLLNFDGNSQNVIWSDQFTEYSSAHSIIKTTDSKILIAGSIKGDSLFVALYDTVGNQLKRIEFPEWYNYSISLREQQNGNFLLFSYSGKIWQINSNLDSAIVIFTTGFNNINTIQNNDETIIFGPNSKLVLHSNTLDTISLETLASTINKNAFQYSGNKEYYFEIKDNSISMKKNQNSQVQYIEFKNIDSMYKINYTYLCKNGDILLIGTRDEKTSSRVTSTIVYRVSDAGELKWSKKFIFSNLATRYTSFKYLTNVTESADGELLFTGTIGIAPAGPESDILYIKLDSIGNTISEKKFNPCFEGHTGNGIVELNNQIYIIATVCTSDFGIPDRALIFKLDNVISKVVNQTNLQFGISPNPSLGVLSIDFHNQNFKQINIFHAHGNLVKSLDVSNQNKIELQLSDIQSGIYFIQCINKNGIYSTKKWIKI